MKQLSEKKENEIMRCISLNNAHTDCYYIRCKRRRKEHLQHYITLYYDDDVYLFLQFVNV